MLPAETDRATWGVELSVALERETAVDEVVEPAVARLSLERQVAVGVPVARSEKIPVVVDQEVVAEVRHVPMVAAGGTDDVAQAETRHQNAAAPPPAHVLKDERQPHDRDVVDIQHRRPRHHDVLVEPFHLTGGEVVVGNRVVVRGDLAVGAVQAGGGRHPGEGAPYPPLRGGPPENREGAVYPAPPDA